MVVPIPAELAAKIAQTFRGTPALLLIILINTLFLLVAVWALWISAEFRYKERMELIRMVDRCVQQRSDRGGEQRQEPVANIAH